MNQFGPATHKLIAHALIQHEGNYLLIKRSTIKRGKPNVYPEFFDIPGGGVERFETPREAAVRESLEETGLPVLLDRLLHEDSQLDKAKGIVFTRLVYEAKIVGELTGITLDPEEHTEFRWISHLSDISDEKIVLYLHDLIPEKGHLI
ncbi:NUDIX hydrolase [Streptococcus caprae]|uniref:NUDIX hydrolase n=1 Tax=Streptococcus caprae TaxID=1640501 RepID=A0ABV8CT50_9STRE